MKKSMLIFGAMLLSMVVFAEEFVCEELEDAATALKKGDKGKAVKILNEGIEEYSGTVISKQCKDNLYNILKEYIPEKLDVADKKLSNLGEKSDKELEALADKIKKKGKIKENSAYAAYLLGERRKEKKDFMKAKEYFDLSSEAYEKLSDTKSAAKTAAIYNDNFRKTTLLSGELCTELAKMAYATPAQQCHGVIYAKHARERYSKLLSPKDKTFDGIKELSVFRIAQLKELDK